MKSKISLSVISAMLIISSMSSTGAVNAQIPQLGEDGQKLEAQYAGTLTALKAEITKAIPTVSTQKLAAFEAAATDLKTAEAESKAAQQNFDKVTTAKALIVHAQGKWLGGAEKGIANAKIALKKATTDTQRESANKDLVHWQTNKEEGLKALKERQKAYNLVKAEEPELKKTHESAQAALAKARTTERNAANAILRELAPVMESDKLDSKLVKCVLLDRATPRGLAEFAQQGPEQAALVEKLLTNDSLMKSMLVAGGAKFGDYGRAIEIYTAIQKASPMAKDGHLQRLALATCLEHARPITQSNIKEQTHAPAAVDPVKRYLQYKNAYIHGELDPAFKTLSPWEYRMVVNCDAPDEISAWAREMLRTYRPDHIYQTDYHWRYVAAVRTEIPYGSQNVKNDLPSLHNYQNIIMNGGVCGRRAFFGRFILRSFGIPTWGVTQHKHAALSHWTPKGWMVNLGAGFHKSWWDKDEVPLSGSQFLLETQARAHESEYLGVLRAQWISRILGETAYNDRKKITGGLWSCMAHFYIMTLSEKPVPNAPPSQELAEADDKERKQESTTVSTSGQKAEVKPDGTIIIPAVAHGKASGKAIAMKSFSGGMQMHVLDGFKAPYEIQVPQAGKYALTARVSTVQTGQVFLLTANDANPPIETAVPYTKGLWQLTDPMEVTLAQGKNTIHLELQQGSRGVTIKDFNLSPKH